MGGVRTTVILDEVVVTRVKQLFGGNLSRGVNVLLRQHLSEEKSESAFGLLKGRVSTKDLDELEREEVEGEKAHDKLYR